MLEFILDHHGRALELGGDGSRPPPASSSLPGLVAVRRPLERPQREAQCSTVTASSTPELFPCILVTENKEHSGGKEKDSFKSLTRPHLSA